MNDSSLENQVEDELKQLKEYDEELYSSLEQEYEIFDLMASSDQDIYEPLMVRRMEAEDLEIEDVEAVKDALSFLEYFKEDFISSLPPKKAEIYKMKLVEKDDIGPEDIERLGGGDRNSYRQSV